MMACCLHPYANLNILVMIMSLQAALVRTYPVHVMHFLCIKFSDYVSVYTVSLCVNDTTVNHLNRILQPITLQKACL